ncbi:MAG: ABC transporter ATP-binding protein [Nitrospirae bacterium]|nr:ABC transporter ATP-binding protein [Nitrospirota bacterium]
MLTLIDISKNYGLRPVLRGINLKIDKAEIVVLFGHNGAGKTTLLKISAGITPPTRGRVVVEDQVIKQGGIYYLGHKNSLYSELTVMENIRFFLSMRNGTAMVNSIEETLEEFGLWQRRNDPVKALSQGMKRRLALMKGIISGASLLMLDEPFSGLDLGWKDRVLNKLMALREKGTSLFIATHLINEGCQIADRVALLERGNLTLFHDKTEVNESLIQERLRNEVCR